MHPARSVSEIDWATWEPTDVATLVFVVREHEILLIRKKRGLGAGKINGPGGRVDPGETPHQCAVRETQEELGITPLDVAHHGENRFQFIDGYSIHVHVYVAQAFDGTPIETDEAIPLWTARNALPYEEMWADDILWLPHVLDGHRIDGRYVFDGDTMLDHAVEIDAVAR